MAWSIPLYPKHHLVPKTLAGPFHLADARSALVPISVAYQSRGRNGLVAWCKGHSLYLSCSAVKAVDGVRVLDAAKEEKPIIVIDNYDSFTYNLCQYIGELGTNFKVYRNDELTVDEISRMMPRGILISPGPGAPKDSGICLQTVLELGPSIPLFGVCMGLQCIGEAFGGKIVRSPYGVVHGKGALVYYDEKLEYSLFSGLPNPFNAARYHSLVIENDSFPDDILEITAWTEDGLIMAARHKKYKHIQELLTQTLKTNFHSIYMKVEFCGSAISDALPNKLAVGSFALSEAPLLYFPRRIYEMPEMSVQFCLVRHQSEANTDVDKNYNSDKIFDQITKFPATCS